MANSLTVTTLSGRIFEFTPVPMRIMPSAIGGKSWIAFQGEHIAGTSLSDAEQCRIQAFMRENNTEALTDGTLTVTLAGNKLAHCFPEKPAGLSA